MLHIFGNQYLYFFNWQNPEGKEKVSSTLEQLYLTSHLYGGNASYIETWYETWLEDPDAVPEQWRKYFESMPASETPETGHIEIGKRFRWTPQFSACRAGGACLQWEDWIYAKGALGCDGYAARTV